MRSRLAPGAQIGDHVLLSPLGAGGMGEVWLVEHGPTRARRALKALVEALDPALVLRFQREGEALARADAHPNVLRVHAAGVHEGAPYMVMELAEGGDLAARLPLPPREAARVVRDVARGLAHAHARGVLHRDLKPENVLFDGAGTAKLADFGLAHVSEASGLTRSGEVLGTPAYIAPEVLAGGPADARSDVYGLGALLYHALTGRPPYVGKGALDVMRQAVSGPPEPPSALAPVPASLEALCLRFMARAPEERPPSAEAVAAALTSWLEGAPRSPAVQAALAVALLATAGALGAAALLVGGGPPAPAPSPAPAPAATETAPRPTRVAREGWARRIEAELAREPVRPDVTEEANFNGPVHEAIKRLQDANPTLTPPQLAEPRATLAAAAQRGYVRAQRVLGGLLVESPDDAELRRGLELLWEASLGANGSPQAASLLGRLLLHGRGDALPADPAAADVLLPWLSRREAERDDGPDGSWTPDDRTAIGLLFLDRGGPGDLLSFAQRLRRSLRDKRGAADLDDAAGRAVGQQDRQRPSGALAVAIACRERWPDGSPGESGWPPLQRSDLDRAKERLRSAVAAGLPAVGRYLSAAAWAGDAEASQLLAALALTPQPPAPVDLLALDGGASVRRPSAGELALLARRFDELDLPVDSRERTDTLREMARAGFPKAQDALGSRLEDGRGAAVDREEASRWVALAALDPNGHLPARVLVARCLFLGERRFPRDPRTAVQLLQDAIARQAGEGHMGIAPLRTSSDQEARLWLGVARLIGEGLPRDPARGLSQVLEVFAESPGLRSLLRRRCERDPLIAHVWALLGLLPPSHVHAAGER